MPGFWLALRRLPGALACACRDAAAVWLAIVLARVTVLRNAWRREVVVVGVRFAAPALTRS